MTTWKAKYKELLGYYTKSRDSSSERTEIIKALLNGQYKFIGRAIGNYSDDFSMVYEIHGLTVVHGSDSTLLLFDSHADALTFYRSLSDRPCNLSMIEVLNRTQKAA